MWFDGSGQLRRRANVRSRRRRWGIASVAVVAWAIVGCSDRGARDISSSDSDTDRATSAASSPSSSETAGNDAIPADSVDEVAPSTIVPEPTGVPGLDDPDGFCASWAVYSGSVQAIGVANAFGQLTSIEVARLELASAASLVSASRSIGLWWPAELIGERDVVVSDLIGPYARRAERAIGALRDAGTTDDELVELEAVWLIALRERDPEEPVISVQPLRTPLDAKVQAAAAAFDAAVTPFDRDPSLNVESVRAPLTTAYLSATCPDLASSGVGDAI